MPKATEVLSFPKVGNIAPAFSLANQAGKTISLKDFRDKKHVALYFYPKAMTPGCTVQACGIRDTKARLSRQKIVVLGISPDPVKRLQKFRDKESLNFDLLSDEDHAIADKYGVWGLKKFRGNEYEGVLRTTFLINEDGVIDKVIDKVKTKEHTDQILE